MRQICSGLSVISTNASEGKYVIRLDYSLSNERLKRLANLDPQEDCFMYIPAPSLFFFRDGLVPQVINLTPGENDDKLSKKSVREPKSGVYEITFRLISPEEELTVTEGYQEISRYNLFQTTKKELLAFAACFPRTIAQAPVAALGEYYPLAAGNAFPMVLLDGPRRYLRYHCDKRYKLEANYRFLGRYGRKTIVPETVQTVTRIRPTAPSHKKRKGVPTIVKMSILTVGIAISVGVLLAYLVNLLVRS